MTEGPLVSAVRITAHPALAALDLSGHCAPYLSLPVAAVTPRLRHVEYFHDHVLIELQFFDGYAEPFRVR